MAAIGTADATRIDAARAFVARVHGEQATVVNRHGNGFCWGWAVVGSAFPNVLEHGEEVVAGRVSSVFDPIATRGDLCFEVNARSLCWAVRGEGQYRLLMRAAAAKPEKGRRTGDFYAAPRGTAAVQRYGGWCGAEAIMVLADQLGLDYVVLFDGRVEPNKELLLETNVRQRLVPPKQTLSKVAV